MSLALGFGSGWCVCRLITIVCAGMDRRKTNVFFKYAQIFGAAAMSFMHGAQDGQKFIGVLFLGMAFCSGETSVAGIAIPVWLMLLCSTVMGLGTSVGGEKIIRSVGMDMVRLEKYQGFSADLAAASCCCCRASSESPSPRRTRKPARLWASALSCAFPR